MDPRLIQHQTQKMILSPQIRQYLKLLQQPAAELRQTIEQELTENPVLEERSPEAGEETSEPDAAREKNPSEVTAGESFEILEQMDENFKDAVQLTDFSRQNANDLEDRRSFQESLLTKNETLADYLLKQIHLLELTEEEFRIADEIAGSIDDDGFLTVSLDEIAKACSSSPESAAKVLREIQQLDPAGVGARNLQETILIQLRRKLEDPASPASLHQALELALKITESHLPLLEKRDHQGLAKALSENPEHIREAALEISKLDPRPGRSYSPSDSQSVEPDAEISLDENHEGKFTIEIFNERIPDIRISPYYRKMLRAKNLDETSKTFLKEKIQSAMNFIQAISMRESTLRQITAAIVSVQTPFLQKGYMHLKPLRLKDIADMIGMHESTVSRAIHGKSVLTPQGMVSYKSFFSTRMETSEGPAESQKSLMEKMKQLIEQEDPKHPLSDQDLVEKMKQDGAMIARRTVAKYRELLRILPSHMRRVK